MNPALLYRPRRTWLFWPAFACGTAIHVGAVLIANGKADQIVIQDFTPAGIDVEVLEKEPEQVSSKAPLAPPPSEQIAPDKEAFPPEDTMVPAVRPPRKTRGASVVRAAVRGTVAQFGSVKALVMYAPRPVYPYEARRWRMTGSGIALLTVAPSTGIVIAARMAESSGSVVLDSATLEAFRRWRFRPGSVLSVQVPITYTLTGASY